MADLFEVISAAAAGDPRRLTTAANVRAMIGSPSADDATLAAIIDRLSEMVARYCNLALGVGGEKPTFGEEIVQATWYPTGATRGPILYLPWRIPVTAFSSVVEDGETLVAGTGYRHLGNGKMLRMESGEPIDWSGETLVIRYTAGWALPAGVPGGLEHLLIQQVGLEYFGRDRDRGIRSERVPDLHDVSYATPGGDTMGKSGLLLSLEAALAEYRLPATP